MRVLVGFGDMGGQVVGSHGRNRHRAAVKPQIGRLFGVGIWAPVGMGSAWGIGRHVLFSKVAASFSQDRRSIAN
jgi:hypothetical protein